MSPPLLREYARPNPLAHGEPGCRCENVHPPLARVCETETMRDREQRDREYARPRICESRPPPFRESMARPRTARVRVFARPRPCADGRIVSARELFLPFARVAREQTFENGNMLKTSKPGTRDRDYFRGYSFLLSLRFRTTQPRGEGLAIGTCSARKSG